MLRAPLSAASCCILLPLLGGCFVFGTGPPTAEDLHNADYGPPPSDVDTRVSEHVRARYPTATQIDVGTPRHAWYGQEGGLLHKRDIRFGWAVEFRAYTIGMTALNTPLAEGRYFFRGDVLEGYSEGERFTFLP